MMAIRLDLDFGGRFYDKYYLQCCSDADEERIQAGKDWLKAEDSAYFRRTGDAWGLNFINVERPWRAEFLPQKLQFSKGKELPDYVHSFPGGNTKLDHSSLVSPRLKALIEAHQTPKDGWQFFPVEILNKDGSPYKDIYYVWWVHKKLDAIDPTSEGVKPVAGDEIDGRHYWTHIGVKTPERLRVLKSVVSGVTAWSDFRFFPSHGIFISDALFGDMVAQSMSGFAAESIWSEV